MSAVTADAETRAGRGRMQSYLASLLHLREEAEREGLDDVATILFDALAGVERWLDSGQAPIARHHALDISLCHALDFLLKWLALPPAAQRRAVQVLASYETPSAGEAAPMRARASKGKAG